MANIKKKYNIIHAIGTHSLWLYNIERADNNK